MDIHNAIDYGVTVAGITALQMPSLISSAPKDSLLSYLQVVGFPFNMSKKFMQNHVAFSPRNVMAGRYHTMITSVYYYPDSDDILRNVTLLTLCGKAVHTNVRRWHFLSIYTGGGFAGNIGMFIYYLILKGGHKSGVLDLRHLQNIISSYDMMNLWITIPYNNASAGVSAIMSFAACSAAERIFARLRRYQDNEYAIRFNFSVFSDVMNVFYTLHLLSTDVMAIMRSLLMEYGLLDQFTNRIGRTVGNGAHIGGILFGAGYYYFMYKRR